MVFLLLIVLFFVGSYSQSTFIQFDQNGMHNFLLDLINHGVLSKDQHLDINKDISLGVGSLFIQTMDTRDLKINPSDLVTTFDNVNNGIDVWFKLDQVRIVVDTKITFLGMLIFNQTLDIQVINTEIDATVVFGRRQTDGAVNFTLLKHKLQKFNPGHIKILSNGTWTQKAFAYMASTMANWILGLANNKLNKELSKEIETIGASIPAAITLEQFKGVSIPIHLRNSPVIGEKHARFDFVCGSTEVVPDIYSDSLHIGISEDCINSVVQQFTAIQPSLLDVSVIVQQISDVTEVNTKTLGGIFPPFKELDFPKDVKVQATFKPNAPTLLNIMDETASILLPLSAKIFLLQFQQLNGLTLKEKNELFSIIDLQEEFYTNFNLTSEIEIQVVKAAKGFTVGISQINTYDYEQTDDARANNLLDEENWEDIKEVALSFGISVANYLLYQKVIKVDQYIQMSAIDIQMLENQIQVTLNYTILKQIQ